jgi:hypothetical protein
MDKEVGHWHSGGIYSNGIMSIQTLTVSVEDTVTGQITTSSANFTVANVVVNDPGDQTGIVGKPI